MNWDDAFDRLVDKMVYDYNRATDNVTMQERFHAGIEFVEGRKYIKVTKGNLSGDQTMVWGFIVKKDDGKFRAGDLLKPASWSAPATNAARGNIFDEEYTIRWTGPLYL